MGLPLLGAPHNSMGPPVGRPLGGLPTARNSCSSLPPGLGPLFGKVSKSETVRTTPESLNFAMSLVKFGVTKKFSTPLWETPNLS